MRRLLILLLVILIPVMASAKEEELVRVVPCPQTKMVTDCLRCHTVPSFALKEIDPTRTYNLPDNTRIIFQGKEQTLHFLMKDINSNEFLTVAEYLRNHPEFQRFVIEVFSSGGSMVEAWRVVGLMDNLKASGQIIETVVNGFAASAGFMIFVNGSKGYRAVSPTALLMWHELLSFKMFAIETPSDKEEEARILRLFQDIANTWIAERGKLAKEEIDRLVHKKEFWMSGKQAFEHGLADRLIQ